MADSSENGNEPSGSIKGEWFLSELLLDSQEALCFMGYVTYLLTYGGDKDSSVLVTWFPIGKYHCQPSTALLKLAKALICVF